MWGFVSLGSTHCDRVFRGSLVTRWEAPGGIGFSSGSWPTIFLQYFDAVGWVSQITYIVLVETLNYYSWLLCSAILVMEIISILLIVDLVYAELGTGKISMHIQSFSLPC